MKKVLLLFISIVFLCESNATNSSGIVSLTSSSKCYVGESSSINIVYNVQLGKPVQFHISQKGMGQIAFMGGIDPNNVLKYSSEIVLRQHQGEPIKFLQLKIDFLAIKSGKVTITVEMHDIDTFSKIIQDFDIEVIQREPLQIDGPSILVANQNGFYRCQHVEKSNIKFRWSYDNDYLIKEKEDLSDIILGVFKTKSIVEESIEITLFLNAYIELPGLGEIIINQGVKKIRILNPIREGISFNMPIDLGVFDCMNHIDMERFSNYIDTEYFYNHLGYGYNEIYFKIMVTSPYSNISINTKDRNNKYNQEENEIIIYDKDCKELTKLKGGGSNIFFSGTYYIVLKPIDRNKELSTRIKCELLGNNIENAIDIGRFNRNFSFSDTRNSLSWVYTPYKYNINNIDDKRRGKAVYYKFTVEKPMYIRVHHIGSTLPSVSGYLLKLDDSEFPSISWNTNSIYHPTYSLENSYCYYNDLFEGENEYASEPYNCTFLEAGTYCIVSEGCRPHPVYGLPWGILVTNIEGFETTPESFSLSRPGNAIESSITIDVDKILLEGSLSYTVDTDQPGFYNLFNYKNSTYDDPSWYELTYCSPSQANEAYFQFTIAEETLISINNIKSNLDSVIFHIPTYSHEKINREDIDENYTLTYDVYENPLKVLSGIDMIPDEGILLSPGHYFLIVEGYGNYKNSLLNGKIEFTINADNRYGSLKNIHSNASLSTSSMKQAKMSVILTPNPANSVVNLIIETETSTVKGTYQILKIGGGLVQKGKLYDKKTSIDISRLSSGIYIFYTTINGMIISEKLVVK